MTLVFFSTDRLEVERLREDLVKAGIACEVRNGAQVHSVLPSIPEAELWIQNDGDCHRAFLLCVECNAGFARRKADSFGLEPWSEVLAA